MNYKIQQAEAGDIKDVYSLIRELAIFEKLEKLMTSKEEDFVQGLKEGHFQLIVAKLEGKVVGYLL